MEETKRPTCSSDEKAQPSESIDQDESGRDFLFQSRPESSSCAECPKREEELNKVKGKLEESENEGHVKAFIIQRLMNEKKESNTKIRNLEEGIKDGVEQLELKQSETDVAKAKCKELEKRNTKLEEDLDLYSSVIDGKDFADGEQQCFEATFASAIGELDIDVPQQLEEGSLSQECTSDEEHDCHLVPNQLKCSVNCVPTVFFNILEVLGYEMCGSSFIKEMQRQLFLKRGKVRVSTCNLFFHELLELALIDKVFSKANIDSKVDEALEQVVEEMKDKDAPRLLLVYKKDDIGHCVQFTPENFKSKSPGKTVNTGFYDVQKGQSWPECPKSLESIYKLKVFKIDEDILNKVFKGPCGRENCRLAKRRAPSAKQSTE